MSLILPRSAAVLFAESNGKDPGPDADAEVEVVAEVEAEVAKKEGSVQSALLWMSDPSLFTLPNQHLRSTR
jgi:hypothetical protein